MDTSERQDFEMWDHGHRKLKTLDQALVALKTAEDRVAQLELAAEMGESLSNSGSFKMSWDTMEVSWSANNLRLFGVTAEEFGKTYKTITEFIHPDDRPSFDETMAQVIATRGSYSHRHRIIRPDGEVRHVREVAATAGGATGNLFFGVTQDITDLVEAKAAEHEMQSMIQFAGEVGKLGGWALDIEAGVIEISPVTARLHDMPDMRQKPIPQAFDFYTPESRARIEATLARSIENKSGFDENLTMVSAAGDLRRVRLTVRPVLSEDGERLIRLVGAMQDITELTDAQEKTRRAENFSRMAEQIAKFGGWRIEAASRITHFTPMTAMLYDLPNSEALTLDQVLAFYVPFDRARLEAALRRTFESGQPLDDVFEIRTAKGRHVILRIIGQAIRSEDGKQIMGAEGAAQDVTELALTRKRAEQSDMLLKIAGRAVKLGGWHVALDDMRVTWSDEVAFIHELPAGTRPTFDGGIGYFACEEQEEAKKVFVACVDDGIPFDNVRTLITAKGNQIKVRSFGEPVRNSTGEIIAVQGAMQDITDLMELKAENAQMAIKIQETIDGLPDAFLFIDTELRVTYLNNHAEKVLGFTGAELIGEKLFARLPVLAETQFAALAREAADSRTTLRVFERLDGLGGSFAISVYPVADRIAIILRDVSDDVARVTQLNLLEKAVSRLNDIILITEAEPLDGPDGPKIVYVNDAFELRTGFTREEVMGKTPRILQGTKTHRAELDRIRAALQSWQPVRAELINYTKSGEEFWLELDITPIADETGWFTHWVSVERDVSERKRSEERLKLIIDAARVAPWEWSLDDKYEETNNQWASILGYSAGDLPDERHDTWRRLIHPEDMPAVDERLAALTTPGLDGYEAEYRIRHKFGHWVWMMDRGRVLRRGGDGAPAFIAGIQMDISEQKERELALTAAQMARDTVEARLKDVVTVSEDIFLELDSDLRFSFLSRTLLEEGPGSQSLPAIGQTLEEWLASVRNVRSSTDWDGVLCTIADRLPIDNFTFCAPNRNGPSGPHVPDRWLRLMAKPFFADSGTFLGYRGAFSDVTQLVAMREASEAANRAKTAFLANMSHELRTPLNGVLGITEVLEGSLADPKHRELTRVIRESGKLLLDILNDILDMSKIEAGKLELEHVPFNMVDVARRVEQLHALRAQEKELSFEMMTGRDADRPRLGDPNRIQMILHNLLGNAIKFTQAGEVSCQITARPGNPVMIVVKDTGIGMTSAQINTVFDEFSQADSSITRRFGGTGLGLAITRRLVTLMGGEIGIISDPTRGTTVTVTLPLEMRES